MGESITTTSIGIALVACQLQLQEASTIFLVFHVSLLKPYRGESPETEQAQLPPLAQDALLIIIPTRIIDYHQNQAVKSRDSTSIRMGGVICRKKNSWEDLGRMSCLSSSSNLEDKVRMGGGDVTVPLNHLEVDHIAQ